MAEYNIGAVAKLTGISTHNLRIWEKRYGLSLGERSEGGRRIYGEADVVRLSLIKQCIDLGHSVSNLIPLSIDELKSNLAQLNQADSSRDTQHEPYLLTVVSQSSYPFDASRLASRGIELTHHSRHLETLQSQPQRIDILIVESSLISDELIQQLATLKAEKSPGLVLFIYRIAQQQSLARLRNLGIRPVKSPIELMEVEDILFRFVDRLKSHGNTAKLDWAAFEQLPDRLFTSEQLDSLKARPYNINCECPRHMSEIIKSLDAFGSYSLQCQNNNDDDAALHAKLFKQTCMARSLVEHMLQEVLDAEGITL